MPFARGASAFTLLALLGALRAPASAVTPAALAPAAALPRAAARPAAAARPSLSLAGEWRFALDRSDRGIEERWFDTTLAGRLRLPGSLQEQGEGDDITVRTPWVGTLHDPLWYLRTEYRASATPGRVRTPFLLQPRKHYLGAAWCQRTIEIPRPWRGRRVVLFLERPHWQTQVWLDRTAIGTCRSLATPHVYDLGSPAPGTHALTIRIDNRMIVDVGQNAHSVTDYTQTAWNGVVGRIELRSTSRVWLDDVQAFPNLRRRSVRLSVQIGNASGRRGAGSILVGGRAHAVAWGETGGQASVEVALGPRARPWDEFAPALVRLPLRLTGPDADDARTVVFGLREIRAAGTRFELNGRAIYLRGTHDGASFPLTGYPATDLASWRRILQIARAHGLNHVRFHSWCPPEAAFTAADELGVYLQPECSIWARDGVRIDPGNDLEAWLYEESARMIEAYGNHPSFLLLTHGNEPEGRWTESLSRWVEYWKGRDPRRLYGAASGAPMRHELGPVVGTQFYVVGRIGQAQARGASGWNGKDYRVVVEGTDVPVITHELGQHAAFPNLAEISKYRGVLRAANLEAVRASLAEAGLLGQAQEFLIASGKLQALAYKEDIEACLRTPGHAGFQLLDLHDYPGQGGAPVGILDVFWQPKGYLDAAAFRRFCDTTVLLARLERRTFTRSEVLLAGLEVAHFGKEPLSAARAQWKVVDERGTTFARGELPARDVAFGTAQALGSLRLDLSSLPAPHAYRLVVGLRGTRFENDWSFWVYPDATPSAPPEAVHVTSVFDAETRRRLAAGGRVLLVPRPETLAWDSPPIAFAPIFWNRQLFPRWERSLGILAHPEHPALAGFPTAPWSDWQWEGLLRAPVRAIHMGALPGELSPVVQAIDDWNRNAKLGLVFEARVGPGRLLVSALDLLDAEGTDAPAPTAARALKRQLLASLFAYMESERFLPAVEVRPEALAALFFDTRVMSRLGASAEADSASADHPARDLIDGDPDSFWTSERKGAAFPHEITVRLARQARLVGVILMNPQRDRKRLGEIREYGIETSADGESWTNVAAGLLAPTYAPQRVPFREPVVARAIRLTARSSHDGGDLAVLAELAAIVEPADEGGDAAGALPSGRD